MASLPGEAILDPRSNSRGRARSAFGSVEAKGAMPILTLDQLRPHDPVDAAQGGQSFADPPLLMGFVLLAAVAVWAAALLLQSDRVATLLVAVPGMYGLIAMWRHSWAGLHFARAAIYLCLVFPRMAVRVREGAKGRRVPHVAVVVTSYNIARAEFRAVYSALFADLAAYGAPATVIAAITTDRDRMLLDDMLASFTFPAGIEMIVQFQRGDGKRSALGMALRCLARRELPRGSVTMLLDGDVVVERGALEKCLPFFLADPTLGALTTNNSAVTNGDGVSASWYSLRYAQRHVLMSSLSLSRRLLVLTGRFSLYRNEEVVRPEFIDLIENDGMRDWLHGRFRFLTGDDKSAWYALLRRKVKMLYIPDVTAVGFEALPAGYGFLSGSTRLMHRWLGNMLRSNSRALQLGPGVCGTFTWLCILDQRLTMWTALVGPVLALILSLTVSPVVLLYYLAWVALSRLVLAGLNGLAWGRFHPLWPLLLAYDQIWGALLKTYLQFRLHRQSWTRQGIVTGGSEAVAGNVAAGGLHLLALAGLFSVVWLMAAR
ncbi:glycosyltransferase [Altererythrobacter sp. CC-YST694]|uniref:glycosyltransferase n=1 Tax=Altererythrobacter sp. CC-YST694 TaxID=2755038 RepID=UPI001D00D8EC|nr:glycosyltransferase [Altererythrobacter sp. CC-YST694]MCB5425161.1 glycosyltransferase [Altererythrobacter sp. CC-YST694]